MRKPPRKPFLILSRSAWTFRHLGDPKTHVAKLYKELSIYRHLRRSNSSNLSYRGVVDILSSAVWRNRTLSTAPPASPQFNGIPLPRRVSRHASLSLWWISRPPLTPTPHQNSLHFDDEIKTIVKRRRPPWFWYAFAVCWWRSLLRRTWIMKYAVPRVNGWNQLFVVYASGKGDGGGFVWEGALNCATLRPMTRDNIH